VHNYKDILLGFGIALISSSILGFSQRLFFYDDCKDEMNSLVRSALSGYLSTKMFPFIEQGIEQLFLDRKSAVRQFSKYIQSENDRVIIIGTSLKGLLDPKEHVKEKTEFANLLRKKISENVEISFLLTHPTLAFLREKAENTGENTIRNEIISALKYLVKPQSEKGIGVPISNIHLYHGTPTIFTIITSDKMLINPYPYQETALTSFCFEISKKGTEDCLYSRIFEAHFDKPWDNPDTITELTEDILGKLGKIPLIELFSDRQKQIIGDRDLT